MGVDFAKAVVLVQLSLLCFTVFGDKEIEALAASPIPPHHHASSPEVSPSRPPTHPHHHHHAHPPSLAPSHHHHHLHLGHPPSHAPAYSPLKSPAYAPVHPPIPHSHPPVQPPVASPPKNQLTPSHTPKYPQPPAVQPPKHSHPPVAQPPKHPQPPVKPPAPSPSYHFPRSLIAVQGMVYCKSCKYPGVDTLVGASPLPGATVKLQCNNTKYSLEAKATTDKNGYFFLQAPKKITNYGAHKCKVSLFSAPNTACSKPTNMHGGVSGGNLRAEKKYVSNQLPFVLYTVGPFAFEPKCPR
ncbi:non-classical arabinogalactan protein 31 [Manihot esculenta]|uniref:Uncharacterized protein n=1 Tax=Manihot esculenta TaxID=3983 RepID=A0A2C9U4Z0_MANES|nr:non-classical arabinogalactan protein 31 [Manihot esculenta]OAY24824.1 hypothetical protein MANES_17G046500v8 [Manihot esculenta]